jgi:gamma-glutamyltranspeptidase/glutathione hydrolase
MATLYNLQSTMEELVGFWSDRLRKWKSNYSRMVGLPGFAETYMPNTYAKKKVSFQKTPTFQYLWEKIAKGGRDAFYKGEIARTIDSYMKKHGAWATKTQSHTSMVELISTNYRGYDVWESPTWTGNCCAPNLKYSRGIRYRIYGFWQYWIPAQLDRSKN